MKGRDVAADGREGGRHTTAGGGGRGFFVFLQTVRCTGGGNRGAVRRRVPKHGKRSGAPPR